MFDVSIDQLELGRVLRYTILRDSVPLTYARVLHDLQTDAEFRSFFISLLRDAPFVGYCWETPPITTKTESRPFEFVLLDCPRFETRATDDKTFASYFTPEDTAEGVVVFDSLGKDSLLIVPSPREHVSCYGHLAAFMRRAPKPQINALWRIVAATVQSRLSDAPLWLSTAGTGVAWLHVRLDSRPKYYGFAPYREGCVDRQSE